MVTTRLTGDGSRSLAAGIEKLRGAAEAVEHGGWQGLTELDESVDFLLYRVIPQLQAREAILHPVLERALGAPQAIAALRREHEEIARLIRELVAVRDGLLAAPTRQERRTLQRALYGLHALVRLHFAKEEEIYLPLLASAVGEEEAARLAERIAEEADRLAER